MATIPALVNNRLPDEAELFAASLADFVEEALAQAGYEGQTEDELTTPRKSLVADLAAKALILPAMSKYKKAISEAEGDGAGRAKFVDKLTFLEKMDKKLDLAIADRRAAISAVTDTGAPMIVVVS